MNIFEIVAITELFNKTHNWHWSTKNPDNYYAEFASEDGGNVTVYIKAVSPKSPNFEVGFTKGISIKRSNEGDQFAILSTVVAIIESFFKERPDAESMTFIAKREGEAAMSPKIRDSRASLYKKMLQKFATKHNFEFTWQEIGRMTEFFLRRNVT